MIKGKEQCLIPEYILKFLEKLYLGIVPEDYGQRMVSKKLLSKMKALYHFYNDKIPSNFGRLLCPEYLIDFIKKIDLIEYTDEDTAYIKEAPEGSLKYAFINACGGMSYKSENLLVLNDVAETTTNGITYKVENGVITFNGTATSSFTITFDLYADIPSGTYYSNFFTDNNTLNFDLYFNNTSINVSDFSQQLLSFNTNVYNMLIFITSGRSYTNYVVKPMLISGSTAPTNWKQGFEGIRDTATTSVVSKDSSNVTIDTLSIPSAVQNLTGYGWGINDTCFNYIDFERKVFVQKVGKVDLGTLNYTYDSEYNRFITSIGNIKIVSTRTLQMLCSIYECKYNNEAFNENWNMVIYNYGSSTTNIAIHNHNYTTVEAFKTAMSGVYLYYELATPVETDITSLMPSNFGYIEVRPEGKVIFNNEYEQAVPSAITYLVEV